MNETDESFSINDLPDHNFHTTGFEPLPAQPPTTPMEKQDVHPVVSASDPLINAQVGNYNILSLLGKGGFGRVYKAQDITLGRQVAIKFLWGDTDGQHCALFEREARAIAALSKHPNIVDIHQWGEYEGKNYIVLEYVENTASRLLAEHPNGLPVTMALRIIVECADALQEAHRYGILHRDVKTDNILIERQDGRAKLTDFGLARLGIPSDWTIEGTISGSPFYMSPEQARAEPIDERSDLFSLGATLHELLTGKHLFEGTTSLEAIDRLRRNERVPLHKRRPDLARSLCDRVEKATAFNREDRYQTAEAFAHEFRLVLQSLQRSGTVPPAEDEVAAPEANRKPAQPIRGKRSLYGMAVAGLLVAVGLGALIWLPGRNSTNEQSRNIVLAATRSINAEDFSGAANAFRTALDDNPEDDLTRYGYCLALAHLGETQEASEIAASIKTPGLQADAQAAVAYLSRSEDARDTIEALAETDATPYRQSLLARLDMLDGNYEQAVHRLKMLTGEKFPFTYQHTEALETLGQALYHLGKYADAQAAFEQVSQQASQGTATMAQAYLTDIQSRVDQTRREDIRARAAELRKLIDRNETPDAISDAWTSRPLTFAILPGEVKRSRVAVESGLADLLPSLLGSRLAEDTSMRIVDRALLQELLAEQQLSGMLSSNEGRLRLGQVLGARLLVKCDFTRAGNGEKVLVTLNDTETTERIPVPVQEIHSPVDINAVADLLSKVIWEQASKQYPARGRLYAGEAGPEINVGAAIGIKSGMIFDILVNPDAPPVPGAMALIRLRAFKTGSGHRRPIASRSSS